MIQFKLASILKEQHISQYKFSHITNIRPNTINNIVNNNIQRLNIKSLDIILTEIGKWGYSLEDFMEYIETEDKNDDRSTKREII